MSSRGSFNHFPVKNNKALLVKRRTPFCAFLLRFILWHFGEPLDTLLLSHWHISMNSHLLISPRLLHPHSALFSSTYWLSLTAFKWGFLLNVLSVCLCLICVRWCVFSFLWRYLLSSIISLPRCFTGRPVWLEEPVWITSPCEMRGLLIPRLWVTVRCCRGLLV